MSSRPAAELRIGPLRRDSGRVRAGASLAYPFGVDTDEIWYSVDEYEGELLARDADPFVVAALPIAMRRGQDLRVLGGPVSPSLLDSLERFQEIWHEWSSHPMIDVTAEIEHERDGKPAMAVSTFSGGVDSAYTVYRHTHGLTRRDCHLVASVMIHGVDIPRANTVGFVRAAARSRCMVESAGLDLVTVQTNLWEVTGGRGYPIAAGLASVLHLLGARFGTGLIPSTASYRHLVFPLGSTPVSDVLLGSRNLDIVHDGAVDERFDKLKHLAEWDEALEHLRVCLHDPQHHRNCGRCHKCMLVILTFRVLGVTPRCFESLPTPREILDWVPSLPSQPFWVFDAQTIVEQARAAGLDEPWVGALRRKVDSFRVKEGVRAVAPRWSARAAAAHRWVARRRHRDGS